MAVMPVDNMLTREDLDALADDGLHHELIDGTFVMTPAPGVGHQRMAAWLFTILRQSCQGRGLEVFFAPLDVVLGSSVVRPDLLVAPTSAFNDRELPVAPLIMVEIGSLSTAWLDQGRKRTLYEEHGVVHYWLADPHEPSLTVLDLIGGRYVETAHAFGDQTVELHAPFAVSLNPKALAGPQAR